MHSRHCYHPGRADHNAAVFCDVWTHQITELDPVQGRIFAESEGAGYFSIEALASAIKHTDKESILSSDDYFAAAAMVFRNAPLCSDG